MIEIEEMCSVNMVDLLNLVKEKQWGNDGTPRQRADIIALAQTTQGEHNKGLPRFVCIQIVGVLVELFIKTTKSLQEVDREEAIRNVLYEVMKTVYSKSLIIKETEQDFFEDILGDGGNGHCFLMGMHLEEEQKDCYGFNPVGGNEELENRCENCIMNTKNR